MSKSKDKNEAEHLRGIIRNLKAENRNLKKQLSRKEKREHQYEDFEERLAEEETEVTYKVNSSDNNCPECSKPTESTDLGARTLIRCTDCKWRKSVKRG